MKLIGMYSTILLVWLIFLNISRIFLLLFSFGRILKARRKINEELEINTFNYFKTTAILLIILGVINSNELLGFVGFIVAIISFVFSVNSKCLVERDKEVAISRMRLINALNTVAVILNLIRVLFGSIR